MITDIKQIARTISKLSPSEIDDLSSILTHQYSIHADIYRYSVGIMSGDEPTTVNVFLRKTGQRKLMVIKTLKDCLNIGLREAKDIADSAPCVVIENTTIENGEKIKNALDECEATIEMY